MSTTKKPYVEPWDGKEHVPGLTHYSTPPQAVPAAQPAPVAEAAPAVAPATPVTAPVATAAEAAPTTKSEIPLADLQAFAMVLMLKRLREMREEEGKS